jgi:hypothetical protein
LSVAFEHRTTAALPIPQHLCKIETGDEARLKLPLRLMASTEHERWKRMIYVATAGNDGLDH